MASHPHRIAAQRIAAVEALKGCEISNIALCHHKMGAALGGGMPGGRAARSGVDMALYDRLGKAMGLPVHALLGGAYRTEFTLLTNLYHKTPEAMAEACEHFVKRGFQGLRVKVGDTAVCHIAAACRMAYPVDCEGHQSCLSFGPEPLFAGGITLTDGLARLPDAPGLGVAVNWDALARHSQ